MQELFFLDSHNLKDLCTLLDSVKASANLILLLSREVLERPYVLAELCVAYQAGVNICVVLVEFTDKEFDARRFRFPAFLEKTIEEVSWFILQESGRRARPSISNASTTFAAKFSTVFRAARSDWYGPGGLVRWRSANHIAHEIADAADQTAAGQTSADDCRLQVEESSREAV